jgi:glycosyltransferase involved in cell wall biosynthesis
MRVVIVTVVHHPLDARITHRQAKALVDAGHEVVMVAPWEHTGVAPPDGITAVDVPRTQGRRRLSPMLAARRALIPLLPTADIVLAHDPDLVPVLVGLGLRGDTRPVAVLDVHEDTAAALRMRAWVPAGAREPLARGVQALERLAERRFRLLLAEEDYQERFPGSHAVVPNTTWVPDRAPRYRHQRAVYVGSLTKARGAVEMVVIGRHLREHGITTTLIGSAHGSTEAMLREASNAGDVDWRGVLPNDEALAIVEGSLAGLSLLHDQANYRVSMPTKVIEYLARGVPVITTPLPRAAAIVEAADGGAVVDWEEPEQMARAVTALVVRWRDDAVLRERMGHSGHAYVAQHHAWQQDAQAFVHALESWATEARVD